MTERDQLEKWVKGENVHNHTRDECCPDFACCQPNNHWPIPLRLKFQETYLAGDDVRPMLLMALSGVVPDGVHVAGMGGNAMTDRELLELAAKAAGIIGRQSKHGYWNVKDIEGKDFVCCAGWPKFDPNTGQKLEPCFSDALEEMGWNPLEDDGDALRLAVKLRLRICCPTTDLDYAIASNGTVTAYSEDDPKDVPRLDLYAATRRAIVRAAAEIGRNV